MQPGWVPLEELLPVLAAADAAIVPHRADPFTDTILPNKLLEYLALGLPTVVTSHSACARTWASSNVR